MHITHTTYLINQFNEQVTAQLSEIEHKELKIILALSDLLEEPNHYEENFINNSLAYLKQNYGLTKSAWKVLLNLYDEIPDFINKLSTWENLTYIDYNGGDTLNFYHELMYTISIGKYKLHNSNREYNLTKLFSLISLLCENFTIEDSTAYVGLFIKEFDNKKSPFSINNLYTHSEYLENNNIEDRITNMEVNLFIHLLSLHDNLYPTLKSLSQVYLDYTDSKRSKNKTFINNCLETLFNRMEIPYTDLLTTFTHIVDTYKKYTKENFITYKGLLELRKQTIEKTDHPIINLLLSQLDKSATYNLIQQQTTIEFVKLIHTYKDNVIRGLEKRNDLYDYVTNIHNMAAIQELCLNNKLNLKTLLTLTNNWEKQGESRGEKKQFKNYNIDLAIGTYKFYQIKDNHQLHEEGKAQSHCVYTYNKRCLEDNTIIVSMKDQTGNRISTIRLSTEGTISKFFKRKKIWYLAENRKRFNRSCSDQEKAAAHAYFQQIKERLC
jgi:hypothetical protein